MLDQPVRVLVLEDDPDLLIALEDILGDLGHDVRMAADSQTAVELSWQGDFDILVTDIRMNGMDGLEALAVIREALPDLKALVITGFSSEADTIRALRLGVGEYLTKPFRMEDLSGAVQRLAAEVRLQRRAQHRERSWRRVLLWILEKQNGGPDWTLPAAQKCAEIVAYLHFESPAKEALRLASLWENLADAELPPEIRDCFPAETLAVLDQTEGMEREILQASRAWAQDRQIPANLPGWLKEAFAAQVGEAGGETSPQRNRAALALAIRLEESGKTAEAVPAYQRLLTSGATAEAVGASLRLARLAAHYHRQEQVKEYATRALEDSRRLGPVTFSQVAPEAGLLLGLVDAQAALPILRQAEGFNRRLGNESAASLAQIAADALEGRSMDQNCLGQLGTGEIRSGGRWLAPWVLEQSPGEVGQRFLARCLDTRSSLREELLLPGVLSEQARARFQQLSPTATPVPPALRIFSLGIQEIFVGEERLAEDAFKRNRKARLLLLYMALQRGKIFGEDALAEVFWADEGSRGAKNLYSVRSIWRSIFQNDFVERVPQGMFMSGQLEWWHDAEELRRILNEWQQQSDAQRLPLLRKAMSLYRGPFLEGCYMDWAILVREELEEKMVVALLALAQYLLSGEPDELTTAQVIEACEKALAIDACRQQAYLIWMKALLSQHRAEEAVKVFDRCERTLKRELNEEPMMALLEERMRAKLML